MTDPIRESQGSRPTGLTHQAPPPRTRRRASRALDAALRTGPFETALQVAISETGLSLDSLRRRLAIEGIHVGLSTLSYWQRGLRRPERAESLRAVRAIEDLCGLPRASLVALLGPRRPRGPRTDARAGIGPAGTTAEAAAELAAAQILGDEMQFAVDFSGLDVAVNNRVEQVSFHGDRRLREDRSWSTDRVRRIVLALEEGVDRFVALNLPDIDGEEPPVIRALHGCRLGRVRVDAATGLHAAELIFDRPLGVGQIHVFDYEYRAGSPAGAGTPGTDPGVLTRYDYGTRRPLRELVLRAHFTPGILPMRCYRVFRSSYGEPGGGRVVEEMQPDAQGVVQLVQLHGRPGVEGFRWEWD